MNKTIAPGLTAMLGLITVFSLAACSVKHDGNYTDNHTYKGSISEPPAPPAAQAVPVPEDQAEGAAAPARKQGASGNPPGNDNAATASASINEEVAPNNSPDDLRAAIAPPAHARNAGATSAPANPTIDRLTNYAEREDILARAPASRAVTADATSGKARLAATPPTTYANGGEAYSVYADNSVQQTSSNPVSTFGLDVSTGSYSNVRRFLDQGQLPPAEAVRAEEMVNYFSYDYPAPEGDSPFAVQDELGAAPWNPKHLLLRVGIKAVDPGHAAMPPANLVFLIDVSGSMAESDKLPLVQSAMRMLAGQLRPQDHVSIVTYANGTAEVLAPTSGSDKEDIINAINSLSADGGTNGGAGLQMAYQAARRGFIQGGINRILLATDGDFNVGVTNIDELKNMIANYSRAGVSLTTLGVGQGNYQEPLMSQLAAAGNGSYAYLDSVDEAHKVLAEQLTGTLDDIADDVKLQVEFNPQVVASWRLIGYEKRQLREQDFRNDRVRAGAVGAGHSVVALWEITPAAASGFSLSRWLHPGAHADELGFLKIRYKNPGNARSVELQRPLSRHAAAPTRDWRFAAAVAGVAQMLHGSPYTNGWTWHQARVLAARNLGDDSDGRRADFLQLIDEAANLMPDVSRDSDDSGERPQPRRYGSTQPSQGYDGQGWWHGE